MLIFSWLWHLSFWESYNPGRIQLNLLSSQVISFITVSSEWCHCNLRVLSIHTYPYQADVGLHLTCYWLHLFISEEAKNFILKLQPMVGIVWGLYFWNLCRHSIHTQFNIYLATLSDNSGITHTRVIFWAANLVLIHFHNAFLF